MAAGRTLRGRASSNLGVHRSRWLRARRWNLRNGTFEFVLGESSSSALVSAAVIVAGLVEPPFASFASFR